MRYGVVAHLRALVIALGVVGASLAMLAGAAGAETYNAGNTAQLVEAVGKANANPGANTIVLTGGAYLPEATLTFTNTSGVQTVEGPSALPTAKLEGGNVKPFPSELFVLKPGVSVTFKNVEVAHGGGAGAPAIDDFGTLGVESSTVSGNTGVGVHVESGGTATVRNSTLSDGITFGMVDHGTASFFNSTVAFNGDGGIENSGTLSLTNTIVAKNTGSGDCVHKANTSDHSLDSDGSCGVGALSGMEPLLGKLQNDGGSTPLHSLKPGSPAIDAGDAAACPATDQRGQPRPDIAATPCDIGADEYNETPPTISVPAEIVTKATSSEGAKVTYTASATSTDDSIRSFGCTPKSGSTFPIGKTTVTCTATDGHETSATAFFTVKVTPQPIPLTFTNWVVTGTLTAGGQTFTLPVGATFNGSGEIEFLLGEIGPTGSITGNMFVPPFLAPLEFPRGSGQHQEAGLAIAELGTMEGSVQPSSDPKCAGSPTCVNEQFPGFAVSLGALIVGQGNGLRSQQRSACETVEPVKLPLSTSLTLLELATVGWHFEGTTTIPAFTCNGPSPGRGKQLTEDLSGPGSYVLNISAPPM